MADDQPTCLIREDQIAGLVATVDALVEKLKAAMPPGDFETDIMAHTAKVNAVARLAVMVAGEHPDPQYTLRAIAHTALRICSESLAMMEMAGHG